MSTPKFLKRLIFLSTIFTSSFSFAGIYKLIVNPTTGKQDYVLDITGTPTAGDCLVFDGSKWGPGPCGTTTSFFILLEDASFALLEDGGKIIKE